MVIRMLLIMYTYQQIFDKLGLKMHIFKSLTRSIENPPSHVTGMQNRITLHLCVNNSCRLYAQASRREYTYIYILYNMYIYVYILCI